MANNPWYSSIYLTLPTERDTFTADTMRALAAGMSRCAAECSSVLPDDTPSYASSRRPIHEPWQVWSPMAELAGGRHLPPQ